MKELAFLQDLANAITGRPTAKASAEPAIDIWSYAEPAGEEPDPLKRNVLQWRRLISAVRDPLATFPGQSVSLVGFVHRAPGESAQEFTLARRVIRCCLADTVPLGLVIHTDRAEQFAPETWLHIEGEFVAASIQGKAKLAIAPTTIHPIPEPKKAYINGVF